MNLKIVIATHKKYWMPTDECYLPVHAGREGKEDIGYIGDNVGDNISSKNAFYCELTALYWAWRNLDADYVGLVHYRRYFVKGVHFSKTGKKKSVLKKSDFVSLLSKVDVILPSKRHYYIETNRSQYEHAHNPADLIVLEDILREMYPQYLLAFSKVMRKVSGHRFNMFVMKRDLFDSYCTWLFNVLFELENRIDYSKYNAYNSRVFGFIGERLLDVWIETNGIKYREQKVAFMEHQNWRVKGYNFIKRKIQGGVDYEE